MKILCTTVDVERVVHLDVEDAPVTAKEFSSVSIIPGTVRITYAATEGEPMTPSAVYVAGWRAKKDGSRGVRASASWPLGRHRDASVPSWLMELVERYQPEQSEAVPA